MAWGDNRREQAAYGSWINDRRERNRQYMEHCMSGEVMDTVEVDPMQRLREFVSNHLAHVKDSALVLPMVAGGKQVFVRLDGKLYHVRRSYASSPLELPVIVSEATVIGD